MNESKSVSHRQMLRVLLAVLVVGGAMAAALWAHFSNPNTGKYGAIIQQLNEARLDVDELGRVKLNVQWTGLTPRDEIFVARRADGSFLAMFPTFYGRGREIAGLMYSSRPLRDGDIYNRDSPNRLDLPLIDVGTWHHLQIDHRIDEHWYSVSRGI